MSTEVLGAAAAAALAVVTIAIRVSIQLTPSRAPSPVPRGRRHSALRWRRRTAEPRPDDVADWCELLARALRSGSSLTAAIGTAVATDSAMTPTVVPIARRVARGESLVDALDPTDVDPVSAAGLALTVLRSCARFGGPAATPLERAAATLRAREAVLAEQQAHSAQARLSARVLTIVPLALLALLFLTDPKVRAAAATPAGIIVVSVGALLNLAGSLWMRGIIGRDR
jgi:tight adherence protein B